MKSLSLLSLLALFITFSNSSCKKDDKDEEACRVTKSDIYDGGTVDATANYTYTGNNVSRVDIPSNYSYTLEYNGDRIVRRGIFLPNSTSAAGYDEVSYNTDGTISRVETFAQVSPTTTAKVQSIVLTYTNGKLSRLQKSEATGPNVLELIEDDRFTYTGNNITTVVATDYSNAQPVTITFTYQYDTESNYFKRQNAQILLIDPLFSSFYGLFLPFALSENNPTSLKESTSPADVVEYTKDSRGNVTLYSVGGEKISGYTYQCD